MANPIGQSTLPDGLPLAPGSVDTVPADWQTVLYSVYVEAHPDYPDVSILKFRPSGLVADTPLGLLAHSEPTGSIGAVRQNSDGAILFAFPE